MSAYSAGDALRAMERNIDLDAPTGGTDRLELALHQDRPIPLEALSALYAQAGGLRSRSDGECVAGLDAGPAVAAWDGEEVVGFVRAITDCHPVALHR